MVSQNISNDDEIGQNPQPPSNIHPRAEEAHPSIVDCQIYSPPPSRPIFFTNSIRIPQLFREIALNNRRPTFYVNEFPEFMAALNEFSELKIYAQMRIEELNAMEIIQRNRMNKVRIVVSFVDDYATDSHELIAMLLLIFHNLNLEPRASEWNQYYFYRSSRPNYNRNLLKNLRLCYQLFLIRNGAPISAII